MPDIERTTAVENDLHAYEGFFDDGWGNEFMQIVKGSKLQEIGYDLARNWKAASNARSLPSLMIQCLDVLQHKELEDITPLSNRKISIFRAKLVQRMKEGGERMRPMFWKKLQSALDELDREATNKLRETTDEFHSKMENHWEYLVNNQHFHSCLWNSERTCYGSIYYSYEWFLKECVRIKREDETYRVGRHFTEDFKSAFGDALTRSCWTDQEINTARLARIALVHNGGRATKQLLKQPHEFLIEGDELQIAASVTTKLFETLKGRATQIACEAVTLPEFKPDVAS